MFGDPVSASSGVFLHTETDLRIRDVLPIVLSRTYVSMDSVIRPFGIGTTHSFEKYLWRTSLSNWNRIALILPNGGRVYYNLISGTDGHDGTWENTEGPGLYYKTRILAVSGTYNAWDLQHKDGSVWSFGQAGGQLSAIRDRYGNKITLARVTFPGGPLNRVISQNGRWIDFTYDGSGRIIQAKDNANRTWTYTYDASGRLYTATDPNSGVRYYTYDTSHRMLTFKDARGTVVVTNQYDTNGRVTRQTYADSTTTQSAYTLDTNGKVTQTDITDRAGNVRRIQFDANGYITTDIFALGAAEQQTYTVAYQSGTNFPTDKTDAQGRVTHYTYDSKGNVASITKMYGTASATTSSFTYESTYNQLATATDPLNHTIQYTYDSLGSLTQISDALSHNATMTYDAAGQVLTLTDPLSHTTSFSYDSGDLVGVTDHLNRTVSMFMDGVGRPIAVTDALGNRTLTQYDPLDRVTKTIDPLGGQVQFGYDANGNLTSHTDQRSNVTQYTYDSMNRQLTRQDALTQSESYVYDSAGRLQKFTDRKGQVSGFTYDALHRKATAGFGATVSNPTTYTNTITYSYDAGNRLTQAVDSVAGTITRQYDNRFDSVTQEVTPQGQIDYTYDASGRRATMTVAGQSAVGYTFDNANRLTQIAQGSNTVGLAYDDANRRTSLTLANGVTVTYGYDSANQLTSISYANASGTLGNLTYAYDLAGRRTGIGGTYARTGLPTAVASAVYDANNKLTQWAGNNLSYDTNGNMTSDGVYTYSWDSRNQMSGISGSGTSSFTYDAFGRRINKNLAGVITKFLYDGSNFVQEQDSSSVKANLLTGLGVDEVFTRTQSSTTSHVVTDAVGSTLAITNASGAVATEYSYEAYGATTQTGTANENSQQYTGRENDGTGLYYYRARYYSSTYGRFVAEDPIGLAGGINLYAYVNEDPVNLVDPMGLEVTRWARPADVGPSGVVGAVVDHHWLKTDKYEAGMGPANGQVPAQDGRSDYFGVPVQTVDHTGQSKAENAKQIPIPFPVDEACVNYLIQPGRSLGKFLPKNNCQTYADYVISRCRIDPVLGRPGGWVIGTVRR